MGLGFWGKLFGGGRNVIAETVEVFRPNAEASAQRSADRFTGSQAQFAAEFAALERKGWFNSLIDGLNRLPRPMMAFGTIGLFVYALRDPVGFSERMAGLALVPDPLWWLMGAVVSFYFGARELEKFRGSGFASPQAVRDVVVSMAEIRQQRATVQLDPAINPSDGGGANPALDDWRAARGAA